MDFPADLPADFPVQAHPHPHGGWPGNELEEVLVGLPRHARRRAAGSSRCSAAASSGSRCPTAAARTAARLDLPTLEIEGQAYVPVFSSEQQFRQVVGSHMSFTVAPAVEFARGLPPQVGIAVNPDGAVGVPLPPAAVAELCRVGPHPAGRPGRAAAASGSSNRTGRTTRSTSWPPPAAEFAAAGVVLHGPPLPRQRRGRRPRSLFVGVELSQLGGADLRALPWTPWAGRSAAVPVPWPVNLVLLDVAQETRSATGCGSGCGRSTTR